MEWLNEAWEQANIDKDVGIIRVGFGQKVDHFIHLAGHDISQQKERRLGWQQTSWHHSNTGIDTQRFQIA